MARRGVREQETACRCSLFAIRRLAVVESFYTSKAKTGSRAVALLATRMLLSLSLSY